MAMDEILDQLTAEQARAAAAIASLRALREEVTANQRQLEGPTAALEHIDFFVDLFTRGSDELGRIVASLPAGGGHQADVEAIRQLASNSAAEQRRLVMFRDKWVNKPLPYEQMRAPLTSISNVAREQVDAFRGLTGLATALEGSIALPDNKDGKSFDRRALFSRLFKPDK